MNWIEKTWNRLFPLPTAAEVALRDLQEAQLQLLAAYKAQEYAKAMIDCHQATVARLSGVVAIAGNYSNLSHQHAQGDANDL